MSEKEKTSASFHEFLAEGRLMGTKCRSCGRLHLPPRPICPACSADETDWVELAGRGRLVAYTVIHVAPSAMIVAGYGRENPYCVGVVELEEGPRASAQILGADVSHPEGIAVGTPARAVFVARGEGKKRRTYLAFDLRS